MFHRALRTRAQLLIDRVLPHEQSHRLFAAVVGGIYILWFSFMFLTNSWWLFGRFWQVAVTMIPGSFVAGATAEGGAAIAFPVFTKLLHILVTDTRTFGLMGVAGGIVAAHLGSGIDMLVFIVLVLTFDIHERISTPTVVTIMGINAVIGSFLHIVVLGDVEIVWSYWLVSIPFVVLGAPLGALVCSRISRDKIIVFLLALIALEVATTILLVSLDRSSLIVVAVATAVSVLWFGAILHYRHRRRWLPFRG